MSIERNSNEKKINTRTLRTDVKAVITSIGNVPFTERCNEGNSRYLIFNSTDEAHGALIKLREQPENAILNIKPVYFHIYFISENEITDTDTIVSFIKTEVDDDVNIAFSKVFAGNKTGKIVVDKFEHYEKIKKLEKGYKFKQYKNKQKTTIPKKGKSQPNQARSKMVSVPVADIVGALNIIVNEHKKPGDVKILKRNSNNRTFTKVVKGESNI
jgi:ribosomal protein S24E